MTVGMASGVAVPAFAADEQAEMNMPRNSTRMSILFFILFTSTIDFL
jgi:hypothetical protein